MLASFLSKGAIHELMSAKIPFLAQDPQDVRHTIAGISIAPASAIRVSWQTCHTIIFAKTFAFPIRFEISIFSLGAWAHPSIRSQTTAGRPAFLKNVATV